MIVYFMLNETVFHDFRFHLLCCTFHEIRHDSCCVLGCVTCCNVVISCDDHHVMFNF